ncbi:hypothetical protein [Planctomicrobium sp. SH664]|uniref:hypothetical protein n=1 Tax=Planctomicrobium sp. SH664 TaxID=3448125 RepID=UPI003F5BCEEA
MNTSISRFARHSRFWLQGVCLLAGVGAFSGCEVGRTWGTMNSNSPMPFLGVDLLPRRKTSQLTPPQVHDRNSQNVPSDPNVKQVVDRRPQSGPRSRPLQLQSVTQLLQGASQEEELSFTGPQSTFSR